MIVDENLYINILNKLSKKEEERIKELSFLTNILELSATRRNMEDLIDSVLKEINREYSIEIFFYFYLQDKKFCRQASQNLKNCFDMENSLYERISLSSETVTLTNQQEIEKIVQYEKIDANSLTIIPLYSSNRLVGIFIVNNIQNVDSEKLRVFKLLLHIASIAVGSINNRESPQNSHIDTLRTVMKILFLTDRSTYNHSLRVKRYAYEISEHFNITKEEKKKLHLGAMLHDFGKIAIGDSILNKPGKLTKEEFEIMKQHTIIGYSILKHSNLPKDILKMVLNHHEKIDGSGYPNGIKEIDKLTQILAVADIVDAISTTRAYKNNNNFSYIIDELEQLRNVKFDGDIVDSAIKFVNSSKFLMIKKSMLNREKRSNFSMVTMSNAQEIIDKLRYENTGLRKSIEIYKQQLVHKNTEIEKFLESYKKPSPSNNKNDTIFRLSKKFLAVESAVFFEISNYNISVSHISGKQINAEFLIDMLSNDSLKTNIVSMQIYQDKNHIAIPIGSDKNICLIGSFDNIDTKTIYLIQAEIEAVLKNV